MVTDRRSTRLGRDKAPPGGTTLAAYPHRKISRRVKSAVLALAVLASLVVLDVIPREQVAPYGRRILLLALIIALAGAAIAGLLRSSRQG